MYHVIVLSLCPLFLHNTCTFIPLSPSLSSPQIREPPVADGKGGSPTRKESKLPKFADWAQGNMPQLDADAVKKHVAKMVDVCIKHTHILIMLIIHYYYVPFSLSSPLFQSVFRVYDKDSSGYISIDEFQSISSNFPFIESFSVLDRDK